MQNQKLSQYGQVYVLVLIGLNQIGCRRTRCSYHTFGDDSVALLFVGVVDLLQNIFLLCVQLPSMAFEVEIVYNIKIENLNP